MQSLSPIHESNFIHSTAIVDPTVKLGKNNYIGPFCMIGRGVELGSGNRLEAYCSVGTPPEHKNFWHGSEHSVQIGNDCIIREHVTINSGTTGDTLIGDNVILLHASYVAHDCYLGNGVTLSGNAAVAGHCVIFEGANLGLNVSVHQYSVIGHYAMLGMGTVVTKKSTIEPVKTYIGSPARFLKLNQYAIDRFCLQAQDIHLFFEAFRKSKEEFSNFAFGIRKPA